MCLLLHVFILIRTFRAHFCRFIMMENKMIVSKALLFDLDGTLVDTTAAVEQLWLHWANKHGLDKEAILSEIHGTPVSILLKNSRHIWT